MQTTHGNNNKNPNPAAPPPYRVMYGAREVEERVDEDRVVRRGGVSRRTANALQELFAEFDLARRLEAIQELPFIRKDGPAIDSNGTEGGVRGSRGDRGLVQSHEGT